MFKKHYTKITPQDHVLLTAIVREYGFQHFIKYQLEKFKPTASIHSSANYLDRLVYFGLVDRVNITIDEYRAFKQHTNCTKPKFKYVLTDKGKLVYETTNKYIDVLEHLDISDRCVHVLLVLNKEIEELEKDSIANRYNNLHKLTEDDRVKSVHFQTTLHTLTSKKLIHSRYTSKMTPSMFSIYHDGKKVLQAIIDIDKVLTNNPFDDVIEKVAYVKTTETGDVISTEPRVIPQVNTPYKTVLAFPLWN